MPAIPAIVVAAGALGSAAIQKNAADKAQRAQNEALDKVKPVDAAAVAEQARQADLVKYREQFAAQNEVDPVTGQIRAAANQGLVASATNPAGVDANSLLKTLFNENINVNPADEKFQAALKTEAQRQLDMGGALSPEQQSELVRAGLESASGAGFSGGASATRQGVGKLLASEVQAQQAQRQELARNLFGFATDLNTNRVNTATGIANALTNTTGADQARLLNLANLADARSPEIGLGGGDIANIAVGNANQSNQVTLQRGAVGAANATARGNIAANLVGQVSSIPGTYLAAQQTSDLLKRLQALSKPTATASTPIK